MKKRFLAILIAVTFILTACNKDETVNDDGVNVDKGLLNVEITVPRNILEEETDEQIKLEAEKMGVKDVVINDNGSVTYKMSKKEHKKLMEQISASIDESLEEVKNGEESPSIHDVKANDTYTEFDITVDRDAYENSFDGFMVFTFALLGEYYNSFNGVKSSDIKITINMIDEATNEIFESNVYPDDFEDNEKQSEFS